MREFLNMNNPPDNVLKNFEKLKQSELNKKKQKRDYIRSTWKFKYIKHKFKSDFCEPIPREDGEIYYVLTENEADDLNRECSARRLPYRYQKYKRYVENQKKILKSKYGNNYPLLTEALKRDARLESEKRIKILMNKVEKLNKNK